MKTIHSFLIATLITSFFGHAFMHAAEQKIVTSNPVVIEKMAEKIHAHSPLPKELANIASQYLCAREEKTNADIQFIERHIVKNPEEKAEKTTSLIFAIKHKVLDVAQQLILENSILAQNAPLENLNNAQSIGGETALHKAVRKQDTQMVKLLLTHGANPNIKTHNTCATPLHFAADEDDAEIINILIAADANKNAVNKDGNSPLHKAAESGKVDAVSTLLKHEANYKTKNCTGQTARDLTTSPVIKKMLASPKKHLKLAQWSTGEDEEKNAQ